MRRAAGGTPSLDGRQNSPAIPQSAGGAPAPTPCSELDMRFPRHASRNVGFWPVLHGRGWRQNKIELLHLFHFVIELPGHCIQILGPSLTQAQIPDMRPHLSQAHIPQYASALQLGLARHIRTLPLSCRSTHGIMPSVALPLPLPLRLRLCQVIPLVGHRRQRRQRHHRGRRHRRQRRQRPMHPPLDLAIPDQPRRRAL